MYRMIACSPSMRRTLRCPPLGVERRDTTDPSAAVPSAAVAPRRSWPPAPVKPACGPWPAWHATVACATLVSLTG